MKFIYVRTYDLELQYLYRTSTVPAPALPYTIKRYHIYGSHFFKYTNIHMLVLVRTVYIFLKRNFFENIV